LDAGHGWVIFALPPAEVAVHPAEDNNRHELYLMCDDLKAEMASLSQKGVQCSEVQEARWGAITKIHGPNVAASDYSDPGVVRVPAIVGRKLRSVPPLGLGLLAQEHELLDDKFTGHSHKRGVRRCLQFTLQRLREFRSRDR